MIKGYLKDLRGVLGRDTERARAILRDLLGEITLEPDDKGLVAVLRGNVPGILGLPFDNGGAGSPVFHVPHDLLRSTYRKRLHTRKAKSAYVVGAILNRPTPSRW